MDTSCISLSGWSYQVVEGPLHKDDWAPDMLLCRSQTNPDDDTKGGCWHIRNCHYLCRCDPCDRLGTFYRCAADLDMVERFGVPLFRRFREKETKNPWSQCQEQTFESAMLRFRSVPSAEELSHPDWNFLHWRPLSTDQSLALFHWCFSDHTFRDTTRPNQSLRCAERSWFQKYSQLHTASLNFYVRKLRPPVAVVGYGAVQTQRAVNPLRTHFGLGARPPAYTYCEETDRLKRLGGRNMVLKHHWPKVISGDTFLRRFATPVTLHTSVRSRHSLVVCVTASYQKTQLPIDIVDLTWQMKESPSSTKLTTLFHCRWHLHVARLWVHKREDTPCPSNPDAFCVVAAAIFAIRQQILADDFLQSGLPQADVVQRATRMIVPQMENPFQRRVWYRNKVRRTLDYLPPWLSQHSYLIGTWSVWAFDLLRREAPYTTCSDTHPPGLPDFYYVPPADHIHADRYEAEHCLRMLRSVHGYADITKTRGPHSRCTTHIF